MTPVENHNGTTTSDHQPTNSRFNVSSTQQPQNSQRCKQITISRLTLVVVVLFVISCALVSIAWLIYHPRHPLVTLNSLMVSNFTHFKSNLMGNGNISVTLRNPNKKVNLELDNLEVLILYGKTVLSKNNSMADVNLRKSSEKVSTAEFRFEGEDGISGCQKVLNDSGWKTKNGVVSVEVKMFISTKFVAGNWLSKRKSTWVRCEAVELSPASHGIGKLLHGPKDCESLPEDERRRGFHGGV